MQLERLMAAVRPRSEWEAMDLGFALLRANARQVFLPWAVVMAAWCALLAALFHDRLWVATVVLWWSKPLLDRVPLHILSRALFGETVGLRETLRALPGMMRRRWFLVLTFGRVNLARAFVLPVIQLEGLAGKRYRERVRVLQARSRGSAVLATLICMNFELALGLTLYLFSWFLVPQQLGVDFWELLFADDLWVQAVNFGVYALVVGVIEPFYVAAGFGLYLNRRTQLEAWDIELAFRRLADRLRARHTGRVRTGPAATAALLAALLLMPLAGEPLHAAETACVPENRYTGIAELDEAQDRIAEVLGDPAFRTTERDTRWRYVGPQEKPGEAPEWLEWIADISKWFGRVSEWALWVVLALLVLWFLLRLRVWSDWVAGLRRAKSAPPPPAELFGLDLRPESLPEDVPATARALWQAGRTAEALGLLYRGALAALVHREGMRIADGATEGDCLALVRARGPAARAGYFGELTGAWQRAAYAHRMPTDELIARLCDGWGAHFAVAADATATPAAQPGAAGA